MYMSGWETNHIRMREAESRMGTSIQNAPASYFIYVVVVLQFIHPSRTHQKTFQTDPSSSIMLFHAHVHMHAWMLFSPISVAVAVAVVQLALLSLIDPHCAPLHVPPPLWIIHIHIYR